jgi:hypothetical protein
MVVCKRELACGRKTRTSGHISATIGDILGEELLQKSCTEESQERA